MANVMAFIKKYTALMIPAGIVLGAFVLLVPTIMTGKSLRKEMEGSLRQNSTVKSWISKSPSRKQSDIDKAYQDEHAKDADAIDLRVKQSTMRDLVSYRIFPEPEDTSVQVFTDFGEKFRKRIDSLITKMNAMNAPTSQEISRELSRRGSTNTGRSSMSRSRGINSQKSGSTVDVTAAIEDAFLLKRASEIPVYGSASLFGLYDYWETFDYKGPEAIEDCWYSQVGLWVYEDIADTITSMNSDSSGSNVLTSPVKRLVGVSFQKKANYSTRRSGSSRSRGGVSASVKGDFPAYILKEDAQSALGVATWTTRKCDTDIDVIHFSVSVIVESNSVFAFMKEICREKEHKFFGYEGKGNEETFSHNQITIMEFTQEPVDRLAAVNKSYRYGDAAVVKLDLVCEYIFQKIGYQEIKPNAIKELQGDPVESEEGDASGNSGGGDFGF